MFSKALRLLFFLFFAGFSSGLLGQTQPSEWYTPFPYTITKEATADSGMVVSAHPLATHVGIEILRQGGNAVDAAVAVQFALAVVYPQAGNIGGGGFMIYRSKSGKTDALDFREKAPAAATEKMYQDSLGRVLPQLSRMGALACGVPGSVDGMWEAHKKYGKLPWGQLVMPAVELAEKGFQITAKEAETLNRERVNFFKYSSIVPAFVNMHGWSEGDWLIQKDLGRTLRRIASEGRGGFYDRATAALLLHEMELKNGLITYQDLQNYHSEWRKPVEFDWNGVHVISMPPPSSGGLMLQQMLGMLSTQSLPDTGFHSAQVVHLMAEVERRSFADRSVHMADPDFWKVPSDSLVNPAYLRKRMADFDPEKATPSKNVKAGAFKVSEQTTHFNVVDSEGNAVSITTTLNDSYGSRVVVGGAGFLLNNEMDDFSAKPGAPNLYGAIGGKGNAVAPNKRPLSSMTPTIVTRNGKLSMVVGTPGGTTIPTSVFQILVDTYWFKMPLSESIQSGRFHHQWSPDKIVYEEDKPLSQAVIEQLEKMGNTVESRSPIGRVEGIMVTPSGKLNGVADSRGDDTAGGY